MKKILYIISEIDKALEFEWAAQHLKDDFDLHFILLNPTSENPALAHFLSSLNIPYTIIEYKKKIEIPRIIFTLYHHIKKIQPDIVHTHLLKANLLGLTAAKLAGVKTRIYTRHHSSYNHIYHPNKVWYDHYCNFLATDIIAISPLVKKILMEWEKVPEHKIHLIPHGIPFQMFQNVSEEESTTLRKKYNPQNKYPVIGVISRFTQLKGIQYIVPAFEKLLKHFPNAYLILAGAEGDFASQINKQLSQLPQDSFCKISFEKNLPALYKLFDIFIHTPIDEHSEAFGQVYIEAMASEIPIICTISGIAHQLVKNKRNALVVPYKNSNAIYEAIIQLIKDPSLSNTISAYAKENVKVFSLENKVKLLKELYSSKS
jgi:glycosyltransferase involved in cell wall biosynthesis